MRIDHTFDPVSRLKQLQDEIGANLSGLFAEPVQWILNGGGDIQALLDQVQECLPTIISTEQAHLVATWCCAEALHQVPLWETWKIVQKLQYNSWAIENWLIDVIFVVIEKEPVKKQDFITLAQAIISRTDHLFLQEPTEKNQETRPIQEKLSWQQHDKPLQEIWWGIERHSYSSYWRISDWFYLLTVLDKAQAALAISTLENPFLVQQLIARVGMVEDSYAHPFWQYFMQEAPVAFEENGAWTSHILAPLILTELHSYLLRHTASYGSAEEEKIQSKQQIEKFVSDNIPTIQQRSDAIPLLKRWSAWLMYRLLVEGGNKVEDASSSAFVDATLLTAIGHLFTEETPNLSEMPPDALHWEHWCNLANGSYWSQNGASVDYDYQIFLKEWFLSVDDWYENKGQQLRNHAEHLRSSYNQTRFPSDLAYLLAYPIAESCSGIDDWCQTWASAFYLRELAEFGTEHDSYKSRSKASELLFFLWQVGFALFDTKAQHCDTADSDTARALVPLFQQLNSALQEMLAIVNTLNREKWQLMPELLALRRLLWQETPNTNQNYQVFIEQDKPRFSDYLESLKHQELELIQLLGSALRNNVDVQIISKQIKQSGICVDNIIGKAKKLNQISAKHYPLHEGTISSLHQLIESK